jgi:hypothetical protein
MAIISGGSTGDLKTLLSGEDQTANLIVVENRYNYININTNSTITIKNIPGFLHKVIINTKGTSANIATLYDNTVGSGTKIATIDTTSNIGDIEYNIQFGTGLTIVLATGTAADITIAYR